MSAEKLLDQIIINNGTELCGIIDYCDAKHVYLFDFSQPATNNVEMVFAALAWKIHHPTLRFSIWATINLPNVDLPRVKLIPKKDIQYASRDISPTKRHKQRKTAIKVS